MEAKLRIHFMKRFGDVIRWYLRYSAYRNPSQILSCACFMSRPDTPLNQRSDVIISSQLFILLLVFKVFCVCQLSLRYFESCTVGLLIVVFFIPANLLPSSNLVPDTQHLSKQENHCGDLQDSDRHYIRGKAHVTLAGCFSNVL
jgi:hypothetical protein